MKILYITTGCFDKGGISRYNRYQISALRELYGEDNVRVLSLLGPDKDGFEEFFPVAWHGTGTGIISKLRMIGKVMAMALFWRPSVILVAHVNLSGLAYMASRCCNAITVLNVYGLEVWSNKRRDATWGLKKAHRIISDCRNTAAYLVDKGIRQPDDIAVIWDCIDLNRFISNDNPDTVRLAKYNIPDPRSHFNILTLGRLSVPDAYYKGYDRLIKVFSKVVQKHQHARLVIAGRGNYRETLETMVKEYGLEKKVFFTGSIEERDLPLVYQSCRLFSLVTESGEGKGEGIPLTPLEAMACAKPVLVGNQDGSREAIIDNNGFVIDPHDLDKQEQVIDQYIERPMLLQQHAQNAYHIARSVFSYERFKKEHAIFFSNSFPKSVRVA
jgi:phosphatidylinositol alpha-1,6-mannosyltransferase